LYAITGKWRIILTGKYVQLIVCLLYCVKKVYNNITIK